MISRYQTIADLPDKGAYARFLRTLAGLDPQQWVIDPMSDWHRVRKPAGQVRVEARAALDRRINARGGAEWRNEPIDIDLIRDARDLDDITRRRIRVYQFRTAFMRARFGHRLARHDD